MDCCIFVHEKEILAETNTLEVGGPQTQNVENRCWKLFEFEFYNIVVIFQGSCYCYFKLVQIFVEKFVVNK